MEVWWRWWWRRAGVSPVGQIAVGRPVLQMSLSRSQRLCDINKHQQRWTTWCENIGIFPLPIPHQYSAALHGFFFISINRKSWEFFDSEGLGQSYLQPRQSTGPQLSSVSASSLRRSNFLLRFSHPALLPAAEAPPPLTSLRLHSCCCYSLVWSPQWQDQLGCTDCAWCSCDRPHSPTRPRRSPSTGLSAPPSGLGRNGRPLRGDEPKRPNCGDIWSLRWRRATLKRTSGQVRSWKSTGTVWWNCKFSPDPCTNEDLADLVFLLKKETKLFFFISEHLQLEGLFMGCEWRLVHHSLTARDVTRRFYQLSIFF